MSRHQNPDKALKPTDHYNLDSGLSLIPRINLSLTVHRADNSVSPLDEWKLKSSLTDYMKKTHSASLPEEDIRIHKFKDVKKRKRGDPVARGTLFVMDLGFLAKRVLLNGEDGIEKEFLECRRRIVEEMDGMELSLEGVRFRLGVEVPKGDDFEGMRREWEETAAFGTARGGKERPDTVVLRGMPSRWFAEPRVSSKPSMLVTHTIFSAFGKIRNLDVGEDDGVGGDEGEEDLVSGLHCRIAVQFEGHKEFCDALKVLCGRSLSKQGSRLRADYEVSWDRDGFFRSSRSRADKKWVPETGGVGRYRSEGSGRLQSQQPRFSSDDSRRKRFKD